MCELAWVTVLSYYGQQKREKAGAAACALPGGGIFTDDILRGMSVSFWELVVARHGLQNRTGNV